MNKLDYFRKYISYLAKKMTACAVADSHFHASRLKRISGREHDLRHPVTLSEKICHRMVLAIGIIVDDAIVVVENVERLMEEKRMTPADATRQAMHEITPAIIGITLVLTAVFIPMGFASGSVGLIYRQFAIAMAVSILFSAFLALTLTPALCATVLKPHTGAARGFSARFNRAFNGLSARYESGLLWVLMRSGRMLLIYAALCIALFAGLVALPSSFLPEEDQGYFMSAIQLPSDATMAAHHGSSGAV